MRPFFLYVGALLGGIGLVRVAEADSPQNLKCGFGMVGKHNRLLHFREKPFTGHRPGPVLPVCKTYSIGCASDVPSGNACNNEGGPLDDWVIPPTEKYHLANPGTCFSHISGGTATHDINCHSFVGDSKSIICNYHASGAVIPPWATKASVEGYCWAYAVIGP